MVIYLKLLLTAFFWGGTFIAGRIVADNVGPFSASFLRFVVASVILLIINYKIEGRMPRLERRHWLPVIFLGLTGVCLYNIFFFSGLKMIDAGRAALIIALNPIAIALLSAYFFKEKLGLTRIVGILLSITGAMVVITDGNLSEIFSGSLGLGETFIFGCVLSWSAFSLIGKSITANLSPLVSISYASVAGTIGLLIPAIYEGLLKDLWKYTCSEWVSIIYLGLFGTAIGFVWYYEGIKRMGPAAASQFINFVPISAVVLAFLILGEPITASLLIGLILVSSGVYIVNRKIPSNA
ncbi:MAG TPA: DMT family transporter [Desulfobacteraceae bacterium]|nr:DMT family transporter [Desulfobacteraceae bacterium]HPJ66216.1 DMT family transporter [Desulfobacteraceae bacterium]HPQ28734.1 DMT family transporter [Desulfobacteraceae bacterium]